MGGVSGGTGARMSAWEKGAFLLAPLLGLLAASAAVAGLGAPVRWALPWLPAVGIELAWRLDGLSGIMLLLITGVGSAVYTYASGYLDGHPGQRRIYILLTAFMISMIGCVLADDLVTLFVFWELTSVMSFLLIGCDHDKPEARASARQAFLVTGAGGLALLAGLLLLGAAYDTYAISVLVERARAMPLEPIGVAGVVLVMIGAFTKSAQYPFHFWLPNAMTAPTPVSAYLHSATMVKLGVYLLARLDPAFGGWIGWQVSLEVIGVLTAGWGMLWTLRERDLKRILAWSTVATLGALVMLIGLADPLAPLAVSGLLVAHALYKAPLFFVAGNIDHGTGTRILDRLGGLRRAMPFTAAAALLAGMSMAGLPLSFGYVVKDLIKDVKDAEDVFVFAKASYAVFSAVAVAVAGVAAIRIFWGRPSGDDPIEAHEAPLSMLVPPLALSTAGLILGHIPSIAGGLLAPAAGLNAAELPTLGFSLSFTPSLGSVLSTIVVGGVVYALWDWFHEQLDRFFQRLGDPSMVRVYESALATLKFVAAGTTRLLQHGSLAGYTFLTVAAVTVALFLASASLGETLRIDLFSGLSPGLAGAVLLIATGSVLACGMRDRLTLLLASGLVGYGCAVLFLWTGAPDLAFTQFTVETVFVIVAASILVRFRATGSAQGLAENGPRVGAAALALAYGAALALLLLAATSGPFDDTLARFFHEHSLPEADGRNVVNVILVDFRSFDTLGEITVVFLSFLSAAGLLARLRSREPSP